MGLGRGADPASATLVPVSNTRPFRTRRAAASSAGDTSELRISEAEATWSGPTRTIVISNFRSSPWGFFRIANQVYPLQPEISAGCLGDVGVALAVSKASAAMTSNVSVDATTSITTPVDRLALNRSRFPASAASVVQSSGRVKVYAGRPVSGCRISLAGAESGASPFDKLRASRTRRALRRRGVMPRVYPPCSRLARLYPRRPARTRTMSRRPGFFEVSSMVRPTRPAMFCSGGWGRVT